MQSRPTELSKKSSTVSLSESSYSTQYGCRRDELGDPALSPEGAGSDEANLHSASGSAAAESSSRLESALVAGSRGSRLSPSSTPRNRSPVERIIAHERLSTPSPSNIGEGPVFKIVPRTSKLSADCVKLTDFPNGT